MPPSGCRPVRPALLSIHRLRLCSHTPRPHPGYAINPARDLGPRLLTAMVGYGSQGTRFFSPLPLLYIECSRMYVNLHSVHVQESVLAVVPGHRTHRWGSRRHVHLRRALLHRLRVHPEQAVRHLLILSIVSCRTNPFSRPILVTHVHAHTTSAPWPQNGSAPSRASKTSNDIPRHETPLAPPTHE